MRSSSKIRVVCSLSAVALLSVRGGGATAGPGAGRRETPAVQYGQAEASGPQTDLQLHGIQVGCRRLLREGQALRLHLVRHAAQHAGVQRHRADDRGVPARRRDSHDPGAGRARMDIQHATDIGALGIIVPTVDDANKAREAAKWIRYPPMRRRSSGQGQASNIWGTRRLPAHHRRQHSVDRHDRDAHGRFERR